MKDIRAIDQSWVDGAVTDWTLRPPNATWRSTLRDDTDPDRAAKYGSVAVRIPRSVELFRNNPRLTRVPFFVAQDLLADAEDRTRPAPDRAHLEAR